MTTGTGSKTISGDVVLPSQPQRGGQVVLIDRGNTALTFVNPGDLRRRPADSVKGGVQLREPARRRHRQRQQGVRDPLRQERARPPNPMAAGDDVLIIDPRDGAIAGRIDLSS